MAIIKVTLNDQFLLAESFTDPRGEHTVTLSEAELAAIVEAAKDGPPATVQIVYTGNRW